LGPVLHDIETILYPYAVLIKGLVQAKSLIQLAPGSGKGQNIEQAMKYKVIVRPEAEDDLKEAFS
jgi:hypothetical protein